MAANHFEGVCVCFTQKTTIFRTWMQEMSVVAAHLYETDGKKLRKINTYDLTLWGE